MTETTDTDRPALPTGTVTFMFTDIEGSTRLLQKLGDDYGAVLDEHNRLLARAIADNDGIRFGSEGDAVFAAFPRAVDAVRAAVDAQRALAAHPWPTPEGVRIRIGLHTGEGRLGGESYVGLDVHRAARIAAAGHGGQILLSDTTRALCGPTLPEGVELRDLGEHRLKDLEHTERLFQVVTTDLGADFPPLRTLDARPTNLPQQLTTFIGRRQEIEQVKELLKETRLLTLTGPGGTGKTRLALRVGADLLDEFSDGVFFVALAPITDPTLVASTIAQALGVQEVGDRPIMDIVKDHLRDREVLLLLDNFEQIVDAAPVIAELLVAAPRLKAIVTTRFVLHLSGEQELAVPPLGVPDPAHLPSLEALSQFDAVTLFVMRARAVDPSFSVTNESAPAVAEICVRLDGLPLAIELAAARTKLLPPETLLRRLEHRLSVLSGGARDLPARQQTLRGAIEWSYDLLDDPERMLFRRLSVFVGGAALEAIEEITGPDSQMDVLDGLASLIDKSFIRQMQAKEGEPRFWMLETIREFAGERLDESGEAGELRRRHAAHFLEFAERMEPLLTSDASMLEVVQSEHDNLRAAIKWSIDSGEAETGMRIAFAIWRFWHLRGHFTEGRTWLTGLLELPAARAPTVARAKAVTAYGNLAYWQGDYNAATACYEEALEIQRTLGDEYGEADSLFNLAYVAGASGDNKAGRERLVGSIELFTRLGEQRRASYGAMTLALIEWLEGETEAALRTMDETVEQFRQIGDQWGVANSIVMIGRIIGDAGEPERGLRLIHDALQSFVELGDLSAIAFTLDHVAAVVLRMERFETALNLSGAAEAIRQSLGAAAPTRLVWPVDARAAAKDHLSEEAIQAAWNRGLAMTVDEAVAVALALQESLVDDPRAVTEAPARSSAPEG